jgi:nucleolar GTP-binding protein
VAMPEPRDNKERPAFIPENVLQKREVDGAIKEKRRLEKHIEEEMGDDYILDLKKHYVSIPEEERHDIIPEFLAGHNIADYIDADIFEKLEELERDDGLRMENAFYEPPKLNMDETLQEIRDMARQIRTKRFILRDNKKLAPRADKPKIPRHKQSHVRLRKTENLMSTMEELGVDMSGAEKANFNKNKIFLRKSIVGGSVEKKKDKEEMAVVKSTGEPIKRRHPKHELGLSNAIVSFLLYSKTFPIFTNFLLHFKIKKKAQGLAKHDIAKKLKRCCLKGEADRFIGDLMPKHLFAGKRGTGKTDRR